VTINEYHFSAVCELSWHQFTDSFVCLMDNFLQARHCLLYRQCLACKKLNDEVLMWHGPADATATPSSLFSLKSRMV